MHFSYRIYESGGDRLLAIADADVIGKTLIGDALTMEVKESFYSGSACSESEAKSLAAKATIINAVGKNIVSLMAREGFVDKQAVLNIGGVPHAQVVRV
ncbi:MAG: DUF424 family protein [Candidatus Aenigmarchaeota archaeon]|nr:DUF424 family protein [Candidatus Aenigmarchaeota archaeon]